MSIAVIHMVYTITYAVGQSRHIDSNMGYLLYMVIDDLSIHIVSAVPIVPVGSMTKQSPMVNFPGSTSIKYI